MIWKRLEKRIFRQLELRLANEMDLHVAPAMRTQAARQAALELAIGLLTGKLDSALAELVAMRRELVVITSFAQTAADVTKATVATEHAAKLEQLATSVSQVIAIQFGKTPNVLGTRPAVRPPREFDVDRRQ